MAKIPVTKTVVRNGQTHVQTYWEEDDKNSSQPSLLAGLSVPKPKKQSVLRTDPELESQWEDAPEDIFNSDDKEAAIAAGLTVNAAAAMLSTIPEWSSLSEHIYEHGMEELPYPKGGWKNKDGYPGSSSDQRSAWENAEVPLETAVQWIDAGFNTPWAGIPQLIKEGISCDRAKAWNDHMSGQYLPRNGSALPMAAAELRSSMTLEEVLRWRAEFSDTGDRFLTQRRIDFFNKGFSSAQAKRWEGACYEDVSVDRMIMLRDLKWSPTSLKSIMKALGQSHGTNSKISGNLARQIIDFTPRLGSPKLAQEWASIARLETSGEGNPYSDSLIRRIHETEQFKARAASENGITFSADSNYDLLHATPDQRETLLLLMDTDERFMTGSSGALVARALEIARYVGSPENLAVLKGNGFVFADPQTKEPYNISYGSNDFGGLDAATADKHTRDKWMKEFAFRMYGKGKVRQQNQRDRWTDDDSIDPVKLKDILIADPAADDVRLEALLVANISSPVVEGWL